MDHEDLSPAHVREAKAILPQVLDQSPERPAARAHPPPGRIGDNPEVDLPWIETLVHSLRKQCPKYFRLPLVRGRDYAGIEQGHVVFLRECGRAETLL
jgi:hypothetical protein